MNRGRLSKAILMQIHQQLPDLEELRETILSLDSSLISMKFHHDSWIPVAAICFNDALSTLEEARYAIHEAIASIIYYREKIKPPEELGAVFLGRFYADDAALRLYSSGEHLANAIIYMLELTDQQLKPYRKKRISQQSILGQFLLKEGKVYTLTPSVLKLGQSVNWTKTIAYRNTWVHDQPPTIDGLGILYRRQKRWTISDSGKTYTLGFGGGDEPEYSIDDLLAFIKPTLSEFSEALKTVVHFYLEILQARGIYFTAR